MKAFVYHQYGEPEAVLSLEEISKPVPKDHEVLVRVKALSLNPAELHLMRASIWMVRVGYGFTKPRNKLLGADVAGVVEAVGKKVQSLKIGDKVLGRNFSGALSEYACLEEDKATLMPDMLSFEEAAAIPLASITALVALCKEGNVQPGEKVLINGASGGIGTFAVQLAAFCKAEVTAVCSGKNADLVRSLGASEVIDYNVEDFTQSKTKFDLVIDLIGNRPVGELRRSLAPTGRCVMVGFSNASNLLGFMLKGAWLSRTTGQSFISMDAKTKAEDLEFITRLVVSGKMKPIIDQVYPFESLPQAYAHLASHRAKGKVVVTMGNGG
jgi:NADPH:quinone reductase-like Zn-dependent oxidoreductase